MKNTTQPQLARSSALTLISVLLAGMSLPAVASDPLRSVAEDAAKCQELSDPQVRLACLDAVAKRLSEGLDSTEEVDSEDANIPIVTATPTAPQPPEGDVAVDAPSAPETPEVSTVSESTTVVAETPASPEPPAPATSASAVADTPPVWAAAPEQRTEEPKDSPRRFEATIVRITSNNVGRHRFYTEDGAVWEQTQLVEVRQPKALPATAEFRRKITGNPTIKFDSSSRSYRVRRIK
ncbi:MAG: hypothetical protein AAGA44_02265 [Pseudomonadota bacterium]